MKYIYKPGLFQEKYKEFNNIFKLGHNSNKFNKLNNLSDNKEFGFIIQDAICPIISGTIFTHPLQTNEGPKHIFLNNLTSESYKLNQEIEEELNTIADYIFYKKRIPQEIEFVIREEVDGPVYSPIIYLVQTKDFNIEIKADYKSLKINKGISIPNGIAKGKVSFGKKYLDDDYILVTNDTSPKDYEVIFNSKGVIGIKGSLSSHSSMTCYKLKKPCINNLKRTYINGSIVDFDGTLLQEGDLIKIDSNTGEIWRI